MLVASDLSAALNTDPTIDIDEVDAHVRHVMQRALDGRPQPEFAPPETLQLELLGVQYTGSGPGELYLSQARALGAMGPEPLGGEFAKAMTNGFAASILAAGSLGVPVAQARADVHVAHLEQRLPLE